MAKTSLIIGKDSSTMQGLTSSIQATGLFEEILVCEEGPRTLQRLDNLATDLICYQPGDLSGAQKVYLKQLVNRLDGCNIPIILFLQEDSEEARIQGLEIGVCDCLPLTMSSKELTLRIQRCLLNRERIVVLERKNVELARQSITDPLTGLHNRRFFDQILESEAARSSRSGEPFSLLMLDLDHFKKINDTFGHQSGDAVLQVVANTLKKSIRKSDTACRYGGEEFAVIMPGTNEENAFLIAERIRKKISALSGRQLPITSTISVSIGIRSANRQGAINPSRIVEDADFALYRAKTRGRNRTEVLVREEQTPTNGGQGSNFPAPSPQYAY